MPGEARKQPTQRRVLLWTGEVARLGLSLALLALLTHTVSPEVLGTYLSVTSLALLAPRLLDAGLPHALGYFLRVDPRSLRSCVVVLGRHVALATPVALALAYVLRYVPFANETAALLVQEHWPLLALLMVSELALLLGLGSCVPTGRFRAYLVAALLPPLVFIACIQLWRGTPPGPGALLALLAAGSLAGSLAMTALLVRAALHGGPEPFPARAAYGYGLRSYGSAVAKIAAQRFDRLFLVTVLGAAGYAHYSLAISVRDMAVFPANLYAMTLRNQQVDLIAREGDVAAACRMLIRVCAAWLAGGIVGAVAMYGLWHPLVSLALGPDFVSTAGFLQLVAFSCGPIAVMGYAWNHLYAMHRPGHVTVLTVGALALALPTFWLFIRLQGDTLGVATAVVTWSMLTAAASLYWAVASHPPATPRLAA